MPRQFWVETQTADSVTLLFLRRVDEALCLAGWAAVSVSHGTTLACLPMAGWEQSTQRAALTAVLAVLECIRWNALFGLIRPTWPRASGD